MALVEIEDFSLNLGGMNINFTIDHGTVKQ